MAMWISALSVLFLAAFAASVGDKNECVYTVYVQTGSVIKGGTDSKIGLSLKDASGNGIVISDLESWGGLMGSDHDYFERGALDVFSGRGPCGVNPPLCMLNLTSDGAGAHHGWYCEYVEVTTTGPHVPCHKTLFYVRQWLALDAPPYQLYATVDGCAQPSSAPGGYDHHRKRLVIGDQSSVSSM
ncbi:putative PLAT/LH2 domain-containing protein [Dioscorea sansibarensis]